MLPFYYCPLGSGLLFEHEGCPKAVGFSLLPKGFYLGAAFGDRWRNMIRFISYGPQNNQRKQLVLSGQKHCDLSWFIGSQGYQKLIYGFMTSSYSTFTEKGTCFKIVIVGERAVGKTSLAVRYVKGIYSNIYAVTVGIEFYSKMITQGSDQYQLQLWDTAGQQCFQTLVRSFYNQASCVVIAYCDPNNMQKSIRGYLQEIQENAAEETLVFVVRTKLDLTPLTQNQIIFLSELMSQNSIINWMALSSKDGVNVTQFFSMVSRSLVAKYQENEEFKHIVNAKKRPGSIYLSTRASTRLAKKKCCE